MLTSFLAFISSTSSLYLFLFKNLLWSDVHLNRFKFLSASLRNRNVFWLGSPYNLSVNRYGACLFLFVIYHSFFNSLHKRITVDLLSLVSFTISNMYLPLDPAFAILLIIKFFFSKTLDLFSFNNVSG